MSNYLVQPLSSGKVGSLIWTLRRLIPKEVLDALSASVPLYIALLSSSLIGTFDMYLASGLGVETQAAVGAAVQILFFSIVIGTGLAAATGCLVSRFAASDQAHMVRCIARDGLLLSAIWGFLSAFITFLMAEKALALFSLDHGAIRVGTPYLQLCALGNLPWALAQTQTAVLRGMDRARACMLLWLVISLFATVPGAISLVLIGPANPCLLLVIALSWDLGCVLGVLLAFLWLFGKRRQGVAAAISAPHQSPNLSEILRIALPVMIGEMSWLVSNLLIYRVLSGVDDSCQLQAAWSVQLKVDEFLNTTPLLAMSLAVATVCGAASGRNDRRCVAGVAAGMTLTAAMLMSLVAMIVCSNAASIAQVFCMTDSLANGMVSLMRISALGMPVVAVSMILSGTQEGLGQTMAPMLLNLLAFIFIRIPLAWLLASFWHWGMDGVAYAILISRIFLASALVLLIWKYRKQT